MEHKNYERELKYLIMSDSNLTMSEILLFAKKYSYNLVETRPKKKNEVYYDDEKLSIIRKGDVIRSSNHINPNGTYFHFMYKKNVSDLRKPYVSKYEFGSGQFKTVKEFISRLEIDINIQPNPVLYAEVTRETAIIEKEANRLLISFDDVKYYKRKNTQQIFEKMLEVEDWTNPNTLKNEDSKLDEHLIEINELLLSNNGLPLELTRDSKPYRGIKLLD